MNPYINLVTCSICGEEGVSHVRDMGAEYFGAEFTHKNPAVCKENIEYREEAARCAKEQDLIVSNGAGI